MQIKHALAVARADAACIAHFIDRRDRFLDALDWSMLPEDLAREAAMTDALLDDDLAEVALYIDWLLERLEGGAEPLPGILRFAPRPRPWQPWWITLAA